MDGRLFGVINNLCCLGCKAGLRLEARHRTHITTCGPIMSFVHSCILQKSFISDRHHYISYAITTDAKFQKFLI